MMAGWQSCSGKHSAFREWTVRRREDCIGENDQRGMEDVGQVLKAWLTLRP